MNNYLILQSKIEAKEFNLLKYQKLNQKKIELFTFKTLFSKKEYLYD
jgi:hypothetical protein